MSAGLLDIIRGALNEVLYGETPPQCPSPYSLPFLTEYVPHFRIPTFFRQTNTPFPLPSSYTRSEMGSI